MRSVVLSDTIVVRLWYDCSTTALPEPVCASTGFLGAFAWILRG